MTDLNEQFSIIKTEIRSGAYYDSIVLMQLHTALADLPHILNVGVMMGTATNKSLLAQSDLLTDEAQAAQADDLVIVVRGEDEAVAEDALGQVDSLLAKRRAVAEGQDYLPQSLEAATKMLPEAGWVLVSVPGPYAADVARDALGLGKHVFLYSDNVSLDDEISLKQMAAQRGLLLMGPDCGTAIINGIGLGFANRVRRGSIGLVGASGTGLQHITSRIHQLGGGITQVIGTGGRDLSADVGAITARQALAFFSQDDETQAIVFISKPPAPKVADDVLRLARTTGKPVVINFIGYVPPADMPHSDHIHFVSTLDQAAELAVELAETSLPDPPKDALPQKGGTKDQNSPLWGARGVQASYLRGLFSGGTLAYEAMLILQDYLPAIYSNAPLNKTHQLANAFVSQKHTVLDLGEDEFTVGRLHPMLDNTLRLQRLQQEAQDPSVGLILLDIVLGYGAHSDPGGEFAPAIAQALGQAQSEGCSLEIVVVVIGTDEDPQDMTSQMQRLREAGARVETHHETALRYVGQVLQSRNAIDDLPLLDLGALHRPLGAINIGLESFTESLQTQAAEVIQVDWKPPARGNEKLRGILARMKNRASS